MCVCVCTYIHTYMYILLWKESLWHFISLKKYTCIVYYHHNGFQTLVSIYFYFMFMGILHECVCTIRKPSTRRGWKRVLLFPRAGLLKVLWAAWLVARKQTSVCTGCILATELSLCIKFCFPFIYHFFPKAFDSQW